VCSGCAKRKSVCHVCAGLPHRVVGPRCVCGLLYADEPPVTLDDVETFGASGIARAAEMA